MGKIEKGNASENVKESPSLSPKATKEIAPENFEIKNNESKEESLHRLLQYLYEKYDEAREKTE
jgi:hypothetical protein